MSKKIQTILISFHTGGFCARCRDFPDDEWVYGTEVCDAVQRIVCDHPERFDVFESHPGVSAGWAVEVKLVLQKNTKITVIWNVNSHGFPPLVKK